MPLLPKGGYTAQIGDVPLSGGRRATAQDFGSPGLGETGMVEAGHRISATATSYLNDIEEKEARQALIASTEIRAQYARKLDEAALSGADLGKLKEEMTTALGKIGEQFQTRKGDEQLRLYTANSEIMYDQQAGQIAVQRAWSTARVDGQKFVNSASALIQSNPAYLAVATKDAADFVATFPGIRPDQRAELTDRLTKDLNMAAAVSAARIDPDGAKKRLDAGEWDLTPEQRQTAINKADGEIRAKRAEDSYLRAEEERKRREASDLARDEHFKSLMDGGWSRRKVMDDPRLSPAAREHLILMAEQRAKASAGEERRSDQGVKRDLYMRAIAPEGTAGKIYTADAIFEAVKAGQLNPTDAQWLNGVVAAQRDENGRSFSNGLSARLRVVQQAMLADPVIKNTPNLMDTLSLTLIAKVEKRAAEMRKDAEAGRGPGPAALLDPDSKEYFFKPGLLKATADEVKQQARGQVPASEIGATRIFDGFVWTLVGPNPADPKSWRKGDPVTASGVIR